MKKEIKEICDFCKTKARYYSVLDKININLCWGCNKLVKRINNNIDVEESKKELLRRIYAKNHCFMGVKISDNPKADEIINFLCPKN